MDWGSDVCSSDLHDDAGAGAGFDDVAIAGGDRNAVFRVDPVHRIAVEETLHYPAQSVHQEHKVFPIHGSASAAMSSMIGEKPVRLEENTSELQSLMRNSYAVFCLKTTLKK